MQRLAAAFFAAPIPLEDIRIYEPFEERIVSPTIDIPSEVTRSSNEQQIDRHQLVTAHTILIVGDSGQGKTWFVKRLLTLLNVPNDYVQSGFNTITTNAQVHGNKIPELLEFIDPVRPHQFAIIDTEGFNKPKGRNQDKDYVVEFFPIVTAAIYETPGVLIYMCGKYSKHDEDMLKALTGMVDAGRRVICIHNIARAQGLNKDEIIAGLIEFDEFHFRRDEVDNITSVINGHEIDHLFLALHRGSEAMRDNENMLKSILKMAANFRPVQWRQCILKARQRATNMRDSQIYTYRFCSFDGIRVYFRPLSKEEFPSDFEGNRDKYRVIQVRGSINLERITLLRARTVTKFVELRFENFPDGNEFEVKTHYLYTPIFVQKEAFNRKIEESSCKIFVEISEEIVATNESKVGDL